MQGTNRTVFMLLLLASLPVASYFLLFKPRAEELARLRIENQTKLAKLERLRTRNASIGELRDEVKKLREAIDFFRKKLPEEREMDQVLREIWKTAEKQGLLVKSVRTLKSINGQDYSEQPIRMEMTGPFSGYYQFLQAIEGLPRITRISEMLLFKDLKNEGQMRADFVLSIFFEKALAAP